MATQQILFILICTSNIAEFFSQLSLMQKIPAPTYVDLKSILHVVINTLSIHLDADVII